LRNLPRLLVQFTMEMLEWRLEYKINIRIIIEDFDLAEKIGRCGVVDRCALFFDGNIVTTGTRRGKKSAASVYSSGA